MSSFPLSIGELLSSDVLRGLAGKPGVYLMKGMDKVVLYVGKAKDLRGRLASYARASGHSAKTMVLLAKVGSVETIVTGTEKEAFILEASLIKKYRPRYNIDLKDDKNYPSIKVTLFEKWPRVVVTRKKIQDGSRYFGPFSSAAAMWETISYLNRIFPLRRCKWPEIRQRDRPCLNYQMGRCLAPCAGKADRGEYLDNVRSVVLFLEGRKRELIRDLEKKMRLAADRLEFEKAAEYRDSIRAMEETLEKQVVAASHFKNQDCFGYAREDASVAVAVLVIRAGVVSGGRSFYWSEPFGNDSEILGQVLSRYYTDEKSPAEEVILPFLPDGITLIEEWLSELRGKKVRFSISNRGNKKKLMEMAVSNALQTMRDRKRKEDAWETLGPRIRKDLELALDPDLVECLDISNIGGQHAVGALVAFLHGEKAPKRYRSFKIRTVEGADDYAMMGEVLGRRFQPAKVETGWGLPDLLLVDGGKGQLNVAVHMLSELGLEGKVEVASIAKERGNEGEKVYRPGRKNPISLAKHCPSLLFLMRIRDEAHRYGITFHRKLRKKATLTSALDAIPGVGPERRRLLLTHFGSMKRLMEATQEELAAVKGIGSRFAGSIWRNLHPEP